MKEFTIKELQKPMLAKSILMEHYQSPLNRGFKNHPHSKKLRNNSSVCIDDLEIEMLIQNKTIKDIKFDGVACMISTASTDIMASLLIGKNIFEAEHIIELYKKMIKTGEIDHPEKLGNLIIFHKLHKKHARLGCGLFGIEIMEKLLSERN